MPMQFCNPCGNLLPETQNPEVECDCCGVMSKNTLIGTVIVSIAEDPAEVRKTPWLNKSKKISSLDTWTKIAEECTNSRCGAQEVRYIALQLRSADEGTTMFYFCKKCDHRWTEDN